ncbi:hypothetical protein [Conexibacter woesei]|uniref:Uncharacterized protein n=1 Tax=Conexibacter woesei (strain DSM 14684 / CCUG 47730 / CIP 108061 / JCM 11494 / NBRC 100937 / ID131577) TaxID=469383 RepID=D3F5T2_CONWI|nr:hypothetical protein [Conexibacter woesei]ADB52631.1 hypothetical protein Cwoe_4217 [Conexibacter woesei DSM 14684]
MWTREKLLHPATAIALLALFVSLGGVTYAAATIGTDQIKNSAVTSAKLRNGAVSGAKIRKNAISTNRIARGAVRGAKIAREGITARELKPGAVASGKLADGAVTAAKLGVNAVTVNKIADGSVTASKLANVSVSGAKLIDGSVTISKLAPGAAVAGSGQLLSARVTLSNGQSDAQLLPFPGIGRLTASCAAGRAVTSLENGSGSELSAQASWVDEGVADRAGVERTTVAAGAVATVLNNGQNGTQSVTWQASVNASGAARAVTAWVSSGASGQDCVVTVQALAS